jgi:UDP-N-acetylglucosamine 2-epimerase (non-hydrolysing)
MRENTERPVTVTHGTNRLCAPGELLERVGDVLGHAPPPVPRIDLWDGRTAGRVVNAIGRMFGVTARA